MGVEQEHRRADKEPSRDLSLREGIAAAMPIVLGYLPLGAAYGLLARQAGLSTAEVAAMSLMVFAGSAQFIAAGMIGAGMSPFTIVATTFLVNLRHILMSSAVASSYRRIPRWGQAILAFWLTDESFVVCSAALEGREAEVPYLAGLQITAYLGWVAGSLGGALLSGAASSVLDLGIDFALPAMFIGLLVMQVKGRSSVLVGLVSGCVSLLLAIVLPGNANVIIATMVGATLGVLIEK